MFWALFVSVTTAGPGSFSRYKWLNNLIGHLCHTPIPLASRLEHHTARTIKILANIDTDESWYPVTESSKYEKWP